MHRGLPCGTNETRIIVYIDALCVLFLLPLASRGQGIYLATMGCDFWTGFLCNFMSASAQPDDTTHLSLLISGPTATGALFRAADSGGTSPLCRDR